MTQDFTLEELMACAVAAELRDGELGFIGIGTGGEAFILAVGIPAVASRLAQLTHAPNFIPMFGPIIDPAIDEAPASTTEYDLINWKSKSQIHVADALDMWKRGKMDIGFISGAQIDKYGNCNIVCIGDYHSPKVRLVGPLAQTDHAAHARRMTVILMKHQKRAFVEKVDFVSGVGFLDGSPDARARAGIKGGGPGIVVSNLAVMDFEPNTHRMRLRSVHPGVKVDEVVANTGFELVVPKHVPQTDLPTPEQTSLIRRRIDPQGLWLRARMSGQEATLAGRAQ